MFSCRNGKLKIHPFEHDDNINIFSCLWVKEIVNEYYKDQAILWKIGNLIV